MHEQTRLSVVAGMYHQWDKQLRDWLVREIQHWHHGDSVQAKVWGVDLDMHISLAALIRVVLISILLPLAIGIGVHAWRPFWAARAAGPVQIVAWIMLIVALIPVLFTSSSALMELLGNGLVIALIAFTLIGLAAGHWLGGPDADNRTVLALATGARHPGVAMAIASVNFPDAKLTAVVVLYHLLISTIVVLPYVKWRTGLHAAAQRGAA